MFKKLICVFLLAVVLSGCIANVEQETQSTASTVVVESNSVSEILIGEIPSTPAPTTFDLYEKADWAMVNSFKALELNNGQMTVLFNGVEEVIVDEEEFPVTAFIGRSHPQFSSSKMVFSDYRLFEIFDSIKDKEYVLLPDGLGVDMVLIPVDEMPKLIEDPRVWNGTQATLAAWEYPRLEGFVQNLTTGEVVYHHQVEMHDNGLNVEWLRPGGISWGYVYVEKYDIFTNIILTQSVVDPEKYQEAVDTANRIISGEDHKGPASACRALALSSLSSPISKEDYYQLCGVLAWSLEE